MNYFAIKHLPTGKTLPNYGSRKGKGGWTNDEPVAPEAVPPGLFRRKRDAELALKFWLEGVSSVRHRRVDTIDGPDDREDWHVAPVASRKAEEMAVVPITLVLG